MYWLYVGDPEGFHAIKPTSAPDLPESLVDLGDLNLHSCGRARQLLESEKYGGKEFDCCASGALLTKSRIRDLLVELWGSGSPTDEAVEKMKSLDEAKTYVLVACEL